MKNSLENIYEGMRSEAMQLEATTKMSEYRNLVEVDSCVAGHIWQQNRQALGPQQQLIWPAHRCCCS